MGADGPDLSGRRVQRQRPARTGVPDPDTAAGRLLGRRVVHRHRLPESLLPEVPSLLQVLPRLRHGDVRAAIGTDPKLTLRGFAGNTTIFGLAVSRCDTRGPRVTCAFLYT